MKYKIAFVLLLLLLSLPACGKKEQENEAIQQLFSAEDPAWLMQAKIEQEVLGTKREDILSAWGEPDGMLSGLFGDIFNLENGWYTILYYNGYEEGIENAVVGGVKVRNKDENVPLHQSYTYPMESDWSWFYSPGILLDAEDRSCSIGFSPFSSYMGVGEYKVEGNLLFLETTDGKYQFYFEIAGENLIYIREKSSSSWGGVDVPDGAVYEPDESKTMEIQESKQNYKNEIIEENNIGGYFDYWSLLRKKRESNLRNSN